MRNFQDISLPLVFSLLVVHTYNEVFRKNMFFLLIFDIFLSVLTVSCFWTIFRPLSRED